MERLRHEFEAVGFYLSAHPLDPYGDSLTRLRIVRAVETCYLPNVFLKKVIRRSAS